ncbi:Alpha/Beta hydrolase protein [Infundibulicybe gibba]|nr:Alpha/Beta hydrolase protein [Infundibulicybe gibba]
MNPNQYKTVVSRRGHAYSYHFSPASSPKQPTILFLHGFPSTSHDWEKQVNHFSAQGFGTITPDLLGYGGTSKPTDPAEYTLIPMAGDLVDILDAEGVPEVSWGCMLASRLVNTFPERLRALVDFDYENLLKTMNEFAGNDVFGYWEYFASPKAPGEIEANAKEWIRNNRKAPAPGYLPPAELAKHKNRLLDGGLVGPCNWFNARVRHLDMKNESSECPEERYIVPVPTFFGATLQDYVCLPQIGKRWTEQYAGKLTVKD